MKHQAIQYLALDVHQKNCEAEGDIVLRATVADPRGIGPQLSTLVEDSTPCDAAHQGFVPRPRHPQTA